MGSLRAGACAVCGVQRSTLHRDHIIPRASGGSDDESNIQYICSNCHEDKSRQDMINIWAARTPEEKAAIIRKRNKTVWANLSPKERTAKMRKFGSSPWKKTTRPEAMKRAWELRRQRYGPSGLKSRSSNSSSA